MRQITFLGLAIIIINLIACGQTSQKQIETNSPKDWETISETDFTIEYPDSFDLDKSGQMGTSLIIFSKQTSNQDLFRENVNLLIQNLAGQNINLDKYVEISEGQIKTMITNGNLIESKRIIDTDLEFQRVVYTGKQGQFDLKWLQYYCIVNQKAYVLTLTCEESQYDNYFEIGEKIMNTFKVK